MSTTLFYFILVIFNIALDVVFIQFYRNTYDYVLKHRYMWEKRCISRTKIILLLLSAFIPLLGTTLPIVFLGFTISEVLSFDKVRFGEEEHKIFTWLKEKV